MILFRCQKRAIGMGQNNLDILIYAEHENDAIRYLKEMPLFWNWQLDPGDFKVVAPPKGPSPSILMYEKGNTINAD